MTPAEEALIRRADERVQSALALLLDLGYHSPLPHIRAEAMAQAYVVGKAAEVTMHECARALHASTDDVSTIIANLQDLTVLIGRALQRVDVDNWS